MSALPSSVWPAGHLEPVASCPVCASTGQTLLYAHLTDSTFGVAPGQWRLYSCNDCGSAYLNPRPNRESISLAYASYYTHAARPVTRSGRLRQIVLSAAYSYLNARYGLHKQPSNRWGQWLCRLVPPFRGHLDAMMRHLPRPHSADSTLLDVGCGHGAFLALGREAGWQVSGLDFDPRAVAAASASGIEVHLGGLEVLAQEQCRYDYITLSHVIEHVHEPLSELAHVYRLLKPGGSIWIETPNINALGHARFGADWRGLETPRHLLLFSEPALRQALAEQGFINIRCRYRGAIAPMVYAESQAIRRAQPLDSVTVFGQPKWPLLLDTLREEFTPGRREFITLSAQRPE